MAAIYAWKSDTPQAGIPADLYARIPAFAVKTLDAFAASGADVTVTFEADQPHSAAPSGISPS